MRAKTRCGATGAPAKTKKMGHLHSAVICGARHRERSCPAPRRPGARDLEAEPYVRTDGAPNLAAGINTGQSSRPPLDVPARSSGRTPVHSCSCPTSAFCREIHAKTRCSAAHTPPRGAPDSKLQYLSEWQTHAICRLRKKGPLGRAF